MESVSSDVSSDEPRCVVCGAGGLTWVPRSQALARITSDARPFPPGGLVGACPECRTIQTACTPAWLGEIDRIYASYSIYEQGGGAEQAVIRDGQAERRSAVLVRHIREAIYLGDPGRMLDIGCGNGAMLASFSEAFPRWQLYGHELDNKYEDRIRRIAGVADFFTGGIGTLGGTYDVVTMLHALEHFADPVATLGEIRKLLSPGGHLFIEVPDTEANPFDTVIADHCCHYTAASLASLLRRAGYEVVTVQRDWVAKELSLLARPAAAGSVDVTGGPGGIAAEIKIVEINVAWLGAVAEAAARASTAPRFGLFGTSLASTWLYGPLADRVSFFVDDDPSRLGERFGKPVIAPDAIPHDASVFLPFPPAVAARIAARFAGAPFRTIEPPPIG